MLAFFSRIMIAAYLIEAGLLLVLAPWTTLWTSNYFATALPRLGLVMASPFVRGAVTGVGLVTIAAGLRDGCGALIARHQRSPGGEAT